MKSAVAIAKCTTYENVESALQRCLEPLGGLRSFVRTGDKALLKVNLVSRRDQKDAVTTDPAIVSAVIKEVRKAGGIPSVGDSPALLPAYAVARKSGISKVCEEQDVPIVNLDGPVVQTNTDAKRVRAFRISKKLRPFDVVINIPKLKTHCFVGMTGAVKNMFGCIPGKRKTAHHLIHQDPISFSDMLLDLYNTIKPNLTIVDAVVGMEGPGPGAGYPRRLGLVIAGVSSIAVDTVCAQILGFADKEVPTVWLAKKRGIKEADLENIDVIGERLRDVAIGDLKKPRTSAITLLPRFLMNLGKSFLTEKPTVLHDRCIGCANCESICSAQAIAMVELTPSFDYGKCIRCYYCHEICPSNAITLKASILSALINNDKP